MGKPRRRKDAALPHYVQRKPDRNRVVWREYLGDGRFGTVVTLKGEDGKPLPHSASQRAVLTAYNAQVTKTATHTLGWLIDQYLASEHFKTRSKATQKGYQFHAGTIRQHPVANGKRFGDAPLKALSPPMFSKYRDARSGSPMSANRELQFIRAVFSWAIEYGHMADNPAKGVRLNQAPPRDRYIEDWEFDLVKSCGSQSLAVVMELAYLLRGRVSEVLALQRSDVTEKGVLLRRTKGSKSEVTLWSDRLSQAVSAAKALHQGRISRFLIHDKSGDRIKYPAIRSAFVRAREKAGLQKPFTLHDIKAKGITDHKQHAGGHRSARMRDVYVRKADEVDSTR